MADQELVEHLPPESEMRIGREGCRAKMSSASVNFGDDCNSSSHGSKESVVSSLRRGTPLDHVTGPRSSGREHQQIPICSWKVFITL